jgi:hypothetical protein
MTPDLLESLPAEQWRVGQIYCYDWHDGPREGVCCLLKPPAQFYFELLDQRYNRDGLDDRLFRLSELPPGSVAEVLSTLPDLQNPSEEVRRRAGARLDAINARRRPTSVIIWTQDMKRFQGCWNVEPSEADVTDWFAALGIA